MHVAVAGAHGLILYDLCFKKWRVFGDVTQEQKLNAKACYGSARLLLCVTILTLPTRMSCCFIQDIILIKALYRKTLLGKPIVMDVFQDYILVTYRPFDVHIFHVKILGELSPSSTPILQLSTVRELSIMTAKSHPALMKLIPDFTAVNSLEKNNSRLLETSSQQPSRCLILRANGELSVLDLDDGHEQLLSNSIELFWVTCGHSEEKSNLIEEVSWLDYGRQGMQVWYPSPGVDPFIQEDFLQLDPELEFDREVYPLGLLPNIGVVVGVSQRTSFSVCSEFPCFKPSPQAQTILHCLLCHFLQRDKNEEVLRLACLSAEKPHFSHCLEWLLFTVFDAEVSRVSRFLVSEWMLSFKEFIG